MTTSTVTAVPLSGPALILAELRVLRSDVEAMFDRIFANSAPNQEGHAP